MRFCLLLSGGLDSTAAYHWTKTLCQDRPEILRAVGIDYGQPHRDAELVTAGRMAQRRGLPFEVVHLHEVYRLDPTAGKDERGLSRAFVPGRNLLFLVRAAMHVASPGDRIALVCGANLDDAGGFPDCRRPFFDAAADAISRALDGMCGVSILTPWILCRKSEIVAWCKDRPEALEDIRASVSCYRGTKCGQCDACQLREQAFREVGIEDGGETRVQMFGGDPHRDVALRS